MPQKQIPALLEFLRGDVAKMLGYLNEVLLLIHNTQLQDVADIDHLAVVPARLSLETMIKIYVLTAAIVESLKVDPEKLAAPLQHSLLTLTELADELARQGILDFRSAHKVVSWISKHNLTADDISGELVQRAAEEVAGKKISVSNSLVNKALQPEYFIKIRKVRGGPAPQETRRQLTEARKHLRDG